MDITPGFIGVPRLGGRPNPSLGIQEKPPPPAEHEELARDEIAGMAGDDIPKPGFVLGIAQASDSLGVNVGNFHMFKSPDGFSFLHLARAA